VDIAAWLHGLGLQQDAQAFCNNAIDAEVLPELTAEDLKDLGVSLVGHRRKLLAAIVDPGHRSGKPTLIPQASSLGRLRLSKPYGAAGVMLTLVASKRRDCGGSAAIS
jgi:hypothetical protein